MLAIRVRAYRGWMDGWIHGWMGVQMVGWLGDGWMLGDGRASEPGAQITNLALQLFGDFRNRCGQTVALIANLVAFAAQVVPIRFQVADLGVCVREARVEGVRQCRRLGVGRV